jgi:hypothetical protein
VDISADGRDENGAKHESDYTITINVNRENHEISINSLTLNPNRISCGGRITLRTRVENTGSNDEDNVAIAFKNIDLGLEEYITRFAIDQGDIADKSVSFDVPANMPAGEYIIDMTTYYDNKESDFGVASLFVDQCGGTATTNTTTTGTPGNVPPPIVYPTGTVGPSYGGTGFFNSTGYIVILALVALLILVLIIVLLVKFVF